MDDDDDGGGVVGTGLHIIHSSNTNDSVYQEIRYYLTGK